MRILPGLFCALAWPALAQPFLTPARPPAGDPAARPRPSVPARISQAGTAAAETLRGTPGEDAFRGGGGADTLIGGAGDDTYYVTRSEVIVEQPGEGVDTAVFLDDTTYLLPDNVENVVIQRAANRPLHGRHIQMLGYAGGPSAIGNALANRMVGSAADNLLDGRGGHDELTGGAGRDVFVFGLGWQHDVVTDFEPGVDVIRLVSGAGDWAAVIAALRDGPDGAVLRLGEDSLTLAGRRVAELSARDFEFPAHPAGWRLAFGDEFDQGLRRQGEADGGWRTRMAQGEGIIMGDGDGQAFVDRRFRGLGLDPFSVRDGVLRISGHWRPQHREAFGNREFSGGVITTEGSHAQQYGFFEARMRLSDWPGGFPAFWLLPADHAWPPEIDVMEQIGARPHEVFLMGHVQPGVDSTAWHIYGLEWTAERIAWFIDGAMVHAVPNPTQHRPMYLLLNYALGGSWAGPIRRPAAPDDAAGGIEIDWVRAWTREPPAARAAPRLRFSLGPLAPGGVPAEAWSLHARATGRLLLRPEDFGFSALRTWLDVALDNDRAADAWSARVNNGWVGLNLQLEDPDGGRIAVNDLALAEIRLGGDNPSQVVVERSQGGLIVTGGGDDVVRLPSWRRWAAGRGLAFEIRTGPGNDLVEAWAEGGGSVTVEAGPGDDRVTGSPGPDRLAGGAGDDTLTGGAGADAFVLRRAEPGQDVITDFQPGQDRLVLEGFAPAELRASEVPDGVLLRLPGQNVLLRGLRLQGQPAERFIASLLGPP